MGSCGQQRILRAPLDPLQSLPIPRKCQGGLEKAEGQVQIFLLPSISLLPNPASVSPP